MERNRKLSLSLAAAAGLLSAQSAMALTFNFTPAAGMSQQAIDGFAAAGQRWSSVLADNVTVNMNINFTTLGAGIIGSTNSSILSYTYANTRTALISDSTTADDAAAVSHLQVGPSTTFMLNYTSNNPNGAGSSLTWVDSNGSLNNTTINISHANAKAMGQRAANDPAVDASISFSTAFAFDFDPKDGVTAGTLDFVGVATHEIGHVLGFSSGVDILDGNTGLTADQLNYVKPMDLFRYSAASFAVGPNVFDWSADTRTKYFSLDGGATSITTFSTGRAHGDGNQASHWKDNLGIGIMDPTFSYGETGIISTLDRRMLDVIGWQPSNSWIWVDPLGGAFNSAIRWSSTAVPLSGQEAIWNLNNTYSMTFPASQATAAATHRAGTVTYSLGGFSYNIGGALNVAPIIGDTATLNTTGGTVSALSAAIGGDASVSGGTGLLSVDGGNLTITNTLRVWTNGTLKYNGGTVSASSINLSGGKILTGVAVNSATPIAITGGTFDTNTLSSTFSGAITGSGTLTKMSAGILSVSNIRTTGPVAVTGGTLRMIPNTLATGVSKITTLSISAGAKLDMSSNKLVTTSAPGTASGGIYAAGSVQRLVQQGLNGGAWDGTTGIITSQASALTGLTTVGVSTGALAKSLGPTDTTTWGGQTINSNSTLVMYTYAGDADLNGLIDGTDYFYIDSNVGTSADGYGNGDFNYDGSIDGTDYFFIDSNITAQGAPFFTSGEVGDEAELLAIAQAVPEPSGLIALAWGAGLMLRRRRS